MSEVVIKLRIHEKSQKKRKNPWVGPEKRKTVDKDSLMETRHTVHIILRVSGERNSIEGLITTGTCEAVHVECSTTCA
ncbi:hypothetical protein Y032_0224g2708 [Ancylostoma ceylanicum]|uniref:Uncharacterized protein n=1 Tax=Ancylostoma ceylanicum TaxID=53326 RepID=A0A016SI20_9BILA|nr:hypothetical protein Y032_0224g2708 [Ancylostoma ceylanicum]